MISVHLDLIGILLIKEVHGKGDSDSWTGVWLLIPIESKRDFSLEINYPVYSSIIVLNTSNEGLLITDTKVLKSVLKFFEWSLFKWTKFYYVFSFFRVS